MKKAVVTKIDDMTFRFTEKAFGADVFMYLLIGKEKALLIDTGYGFTDVPKAIQSLSSLPLIIVNTHGHLDHIHGNHLYPEVLISEEEAEVFGRHNDANYLKELLYKLAKRNNIPKVLLNLPFFNVKAVIKSYPSTCKPLPTTMFFELGERRVSIIKTSGHTLGSISLLDEKNKYLFSGDTDCRDGVLLSFPESSSVSTFRHSIYILNELVKDDKVTTIFPSHQESPLDVGILKTYLDACDALLSKPLDELDENERLFKWNGLIISYTSDKLGD